MKKKRIPKNLDYLLVANGKPISAKRLKAISQGRSMIALDGAAEVLRKLKLTPKLIFGDFDSISPATARYFQKKGVNLFHAPDQNNTDLEKALLYCIVQNPRSISICSALGKRSDHTLANISFLKKFHRKDIPLILLEENERIFYARNQTLLLRCRKHAPFAVLGFPKASIHSDGLLYEMKNMKLELGVAESISNLAEKSLVSLKIQGEALVIVED